MTLKIINAKELQIADLIMNIYWNKSFPDNQFLKLCIKCLKEKWTDGNLRSVDEFLNELLQGKYDDFLSSVNNKENIIYSLCFDKVFVW